MRRLLVQIAVLALGCGDGVPADPTWFRDVQPILVANCARCHGADPYEPTLAGFRLDRYVAGDEQRFDAFDYQTLIGLVAADRGTPAMPPDYSLTQRQRDILRRWVDDGAPKGQRSNAPPSAVAVSPTDEAITVDQLIELTLRAWDDDGDGLWVAVAVREHGADNIEVLASELGGGLRNIEVDTGVLVSQRTYDVIAIVDDGYSDDPTANQTEVVLLSDVLVDHGERGTAPRVTVLSPNGGTTLVGESTITWSASDPDPGDSLTIDIDLIRVEPDGSEVVAESIASGLANDVQSYLWDVSNVPSTGANGDSILYKVRVTATDFGAKNSRSDQSDAPFTVAAGGTTSLSWADVKPTFVTYCAPCHGQPARTPALEYFRLDKYNAADTTPPVNSDEGVFEVSADVYQRLVVQGNMPPNGEPQPPASAVNDIAEWILGGAPFGDGPNDGPPTFVWSVPNDSAITNTGTGNVTLSWSASDPEGMPLTGGISYVEISPPAPALAKCDASLTGWIDIADADVTAGTYDFVAPHQGYFCLRGDVTDAADQTTTAIAGRPIHY